jgi:hypothetical protein
LVVVVLLVALLLEHRTDYFQRVVALAWLRAHLNQTDYFQRVVALA